MKRLIALLLVCTILTGCTTVTVYEQKEVKEEVITPVITEDIEFKGMDDPDFLDHIEETVYSDLVLQLNSEDYFIENIEAIYISDEYIQESIYNSQTNVFFGESLATLNELFPDEKYVFTLDKNGSTTVIPFEKYDNTFDRIIKNVAIGTGVILICVTISFVSKLAGAHAMNVIFAAAAKESAISAVSYSLFSGVTSGIVTGIETGDFNEALKSAALNGSEGFKWGAITGAATGGLSKTSELYGATLNGLTMNQAAAIQKESGLPLEFIKNFHSVEEYNVLKNAGLTLTKVNNKYALTQKIDWDFVGDLEDGRTNAQRVIDGLAPLDASGKSYELHHIGQKAGSPLAILTSTQHKSNYKVLHANTGGTASAVDHGTVWNKQKHDFWTEMLNNR